MKGVGLNAVEIEQAVSELAEKPFDAREFPFAFLEAFGRKAVTLKKLRSGDSNRSDLGGVLQTGHIHVVVAAPGTVTEALQALKASPATARAKARFVLATDGATLEAEDLQSDDAPVVCAYEDFPDRFAAFLPLAGITTVRQVRESSFDIRATGRLNKLYLELRRLNPDWDRAERRPDMNHFLVRLIFCFFAQSTDIFFGEGLFSDTVAKMSARDGSDAHEVVETIFRAMSMGSEEKAAARLPRWAGAFPCVSGWLFSGDMAVPRFSGIARSYLLHIGGLDWRKINPDIFGSMIQAVADDDERGALGMHYTSVPNILKVLNPLFLDDLRKRLEEAGDNARTLLNLRRRMARIRVFDPACGSGNFLVIAYKEMRAIEAEINRRRGEEDEKTAIPLTNFRGIEIRDFPAEVARLALIIAEYQCNVLYRGQKEALKDFLPLDAQNWITCGNALRLDWPGICPPSGTGVRLLADDLFSSPRDQARVSFENGGGETYICGNPPFTGTRKQTVEQKDDLRRVFSRHTAKWKNADYVGAWLIKAASYNELHAAPFAFVATNSLCQGQQVPITWAVMRDMGFKIRFAHTSFIWQNLAKNRAGVTVIIVGLDADEAGERHLMTETDKRAVKNINPYLTEHDIDIVLPSRRPMFTSVAMDYGVYYSKSAGLLLTPDEARGLMQAGFPQELLRKFLGSTEFINGVERFCLWLDDPDLPTADRFPEVRRRIDSVRKDRTETDDVAVNKLAARPHRFRERKGENRQKLIIPIVSSENRDYFPAGLVDDSIIPTNKTFYIGDAPLWCLAILSSKLHLAWVAAICGRLRSDYSYSNTLGWNTFPIPALTNKHVMDLTACAQDIAFTRESHFPASLADLYEVRAGVSMMPEDLRSAHERNDDVVERIYVGRRFKSDTERLGKLFDLYTAMIARRAG